MHPTPSLSHFKSKDYESFYEPSEDSFLLMDAIEKDMEFIIARNPSYCLEIGSGSGCVISFAASLLGCSRVYFATDLNPSANLATEKTAEMNNVHFADT